MKTVLQKWIGVVRKIYSKHFDATLYNSDTLDIEEVEIPLCHLDGSNIKDVKENIRFKLTIYENAITEATQTLSAEYELYQPITPTPEVIEERIKMYQDILGIRRTTNDM